MTVARRRPGRRPGAVDTRGEILAAARKVFAEKGFDRATVRGIAREAGVDPALVHHYFASKEGVFVAAMRLPLNPAELVPRVLAGPREGVGERLARLLLTTLDDAATRQPILAVLRTAVTNDQGAALLREFVTQVILSRVVEELGTPPLRMEAAFAQMFGVLMLRYIVRMEPLASADVEELVGLLAPTLQRYLAPA